MTHDSQDKTLTAIVTGSSTGLGFAIAKRFLAEGKNVVLNARSADDLRRAVSELNAPQNIAYVAGDISDKAVAAKLVATALETFGGLDILVNNAGIFAPKPFLETEEADLDKFFAINFKGSYFAAQAAVPAMIKRGGGAIINIGTTLVEHAIAGLPVSAAMASKAALHSLTQQLSAELGKDNIRVSTIATGIVETPLHTKLGVDVSGLVGLHLLGRNGKPEDVAEAVSMLAANNFITGTVLRVDGGHAAGHQYG